MDYSFQRYLLAKRSVDDRALNRRVWQALLEHLAGVEGRPSLYALELGGGIGTMFERLVEWGALARAEYSLVDDQPENIAYGMEHLARWGLHQGLKVASYERRLFFQGRDTAFQVDFYPETVQEFAERERGRRVWDLIVAHAFLDLVDVPLLLDDLRMLTRQGGLLYLTINFDGLTALEPPLDANLDERIMALYHRSMDTRTSGGGSRSGRRLFGWLRDAGLRIIDAGGSDWTVFARDGRYGGDEAYFLHFILHFFEESLQGSPELAPGELERWLAARRRQIDTGELVYIAHQMDFLVEVP